MTWTTSVASVGENPGGDFGPDEPSTVAPAPFSVTGPTSVELDRATRTQTVSFAVLNTSGRPVRVRLLPRALAGADPGWLAVVGDAERPLGNAATLTAEVAITVPPTAPEGQHAMRLDVSPEDRTELVAEGQSVAFTVPPPVPRKPFPRWLLLAILGAVLVLVLGALAIWWFVVREPGPQARRAPQVSGEPTVGQVLTVTPGTWEPDDVQLVHVWQSCPPAATEEDPQGCTDVSLGGATAIGGTFTVGAELEGRRIRVTESALTGDEDDPTVTDQVSGLTAAVAPAPVPQVVVPGLLGEPRSIAFQALADLGLTVRLEEVGQSGVCDPPVEVQDPGAGTPVAVGSSVRISTGRPLSWFDCGFVLPFPDGVLLDRDTLDDAVIGEFRMPRDLLTP